ncbi:hypothetical protein A3X38_16030 [Salmonella enterica subsp. enterica serovar Florida]|uniref:Uncharacterized protein n=3 Tax=Salmonella enterica I TaxID=59201 RepID=A0A5U8JFC6_SALET|nr:hypothetical protein [Salmonella enterica]EBR7996280.1 hypothetical protein [Salmonella enterica subsp. enterica serovar Panama]EBS4088565.1 hypothetical protein [Salmonella enterica subsp. enterica serovar Newport]EBW8394247.1 hypothetical protein [Salmonella enterica subsp. enterica serovar Florida]ASD87167.1 hypothetical protein LFZ16_13440 [Salmonella enterica subsp. enterica serovar India str. SA20085604]EBR8435959.1 hypothetical protein [Salmonella enterica subsp. enterica serovar Pan
MPAIDIVSMRGEMPRVLPHMLPDGYAALAQNCHFRFGVITPVSDDGKSGVTFDINPETLFLYSQNKWFTWQGMVDAVRSPVAQDPYGRVYYTDGQYPKVTSAQIATSGSGPYPANSYRLGVPAPESAITCTVYNPPVPTPDKTTDASDNNAAPQEQEDDPTDNETRFYTCTFVTAYGEEGPPGPQSPELTVKKGGSADLTMQPPPLQHSNITRRRIYRSVSGGGNADFLLVTELDAGVLSFHDDLLAEQLGPALETWHYVMPPDNMLGLCMMANGIAAGFAGNEVMFSEAFLPYAWPDAYRQTTTEDIVAIAPIGTALVVATKGEPYLFSGVSPSNISGAKLPLTQACVSRQSMVVMDGFVLYAGTNGLVSVDGSGNAVIATEKIISPEQWRGMFNPSSIKAYQYRGEYVARYTKTDGGQAVFIFNPQDMDIRHMSTTFDTAYNDTATDTLYLVKGRELSVSQGADTPLLLVWRSKTFIAQENTSFSCLRVKAPYPERVGISVFADGQPVIQLPPGALSGSVLKLPPVTGREWYLEVSGFGQIERITLSTSMAEMPA